MGDDIWAVLQPLAENAAPHKKQKSPPVAVRQMPFIRGQLKILPGSKKTHADPRGFLFRSLGLGSQRG